MTRWEYAEAFWSPAQVTISFFSPAGAQEHKFPSAQWASMCGRLGAEGWEMVAAMPSPTPIQEYFYYFKRPLPG